MASPRETTWLIGVFAVLALIITAAGLAGVMTLAVTQRTREIGIRIALGASRVRILTMMMRQALTLMLLGLAAGLVGALMLNRLITALLFATPVVNPVTFVAVACLLTLVGAAACLIPSLNATGIDPTLTLRKE
jgi:putative ABC transport system permease protein